jgi:hypothetical protein
MINQSNSRLDDINELSLIYYHLHLTLNIQENNCKRFIVDANDIIIKHSYISNGFVVALVLKMSIFLPLMNCIKSIITIFHFLKEYLLVRKAVLGIFR